MRGGVDNQTCFFRLDMTTGCAGYWFILEEDS